MATQIKIGSTVMAPITNDNGEEGFVIGTLIGLNKRMAKVDLGDGKIINVGKTKIESFKAKKDGDDKSTGRIAEKYKYNTCRAASGRQSCDNGDNVAQELREMTLGDAYKLIAKTIGVPLKELTAKYSHLNPGQQRMCIGNRLRGYYKNI